MSTPWPAPDLDYPESDGEPLAETGVHVRELLDSRWVLQQRYRDDADVYVASNMFVYYEQGNPRAVFAPDVFVVHGVPKEPERRTFKIWEEGRAPSFVLEISSRSAWVEDLGNKKAICARLGVREYFLWDPEGEYLTPRLQGYRLQGGEYHRIAPDHGGGVASETLGVVFHAEESRLVASDAVTGERLLRPDDVRAARDDAEKRLAAAEIELATLRRRMGGDPEA
jgi:Uma2 family endonuclease